MSEKIGIIITVENYQASPFGLNKVDYATNDGIEIKKVFSEVLKIDKNNIYCYQDEQFTRSTAMEEIQYYLTQMPIETELYLYYAGHGFFSEGKNYLTTYDTSKLDLVGTSLSFEELFFDTFRKSRAKACIAFIDACAESTSSNERGLSIRGLDFRNTTMCDESEFRYALYFSCSPYEKSISDDTLQHGIWTSCLLDALTGDESAYDGGKYISTRSLDEYLRKAVRQYIGDRNKQTPYAIISSSGEWKIVDFDGEYSFEEGVYSAYEDFFFQCNSANQECDIGAYSEIHNFAQARDVCWCISESLCPDWEEIVTKLEFYYNALIRGRAGNLSYSEQKENLDDFTRLNQSFPTYYNKLF